MNATDAIESLTSSIDNLINNLGSITAAAKPSQMPQFDGSIMSLVAAPVTAAINSHGTDAGRPNDSAFRKASDAFSDGMSKLLTLVNDIVAKSGAIEKMVDVFNEIVDAAALVIIVFEAVSGLVTKYAGELFKIISDNIAGVINWISNAVSNLFSSISKFISNLFGGGDDSQNQEGGGGGMFEGVIKTLSWFADCLLKVGNIVVSAFAYPMKTLNIILESAKSAFVALGKAVVDATIWLGDWTGFDTSKLKSVSESLGKSYENSQQKMSANFEDIFKLAETKPLQAGWENMKTTAIETFDAAVPKVQDFGKGIVDDFLNMDVRSASKENKAVQGSFYAAAASANMNEAPMVRQQKQTNTYIKTIAEHLQKYLS